MRLRDVNEILTEAAMSLTEASEIEFELLKSKHSHTYKLKVNAKIGKTRLTGTSLQFSLGLDKVGQKLSNDIFPDTKIHRDPPGKPPTWSMLNAIRRAADRRLSELESKAKREKWEL